MHTKNRKRFIASGIIPALLIAVCSLVTVSCKSEVLPPPPAPQLQPVSPTPESTPTPVTSNITITASEFKVSQNAAMIMFPKSITFLITVNSNIQLKQIELRYWTEKHSLAPVANKTNVEFDKGSKVTTSWILDFTKSEMIPPGATVWWEWKLTDDEGTSFPVAKASTIYEDTRIQWDLTKLGSMDIYWLNQSDSLRKALTSSLQDNLSRVQLDVTIPEERKPKIYVYRNSDQVQSALLNARDWTGAVAFPNYNIILTAVDTYNLTWAKTTLAHEITHLMVGELTFGPFSSSFPLWLNEGIATYAEGPLDKENQDALNAAFAGNTLFPLKNLAGRFPDDSSQAILCYAESGSVVTYLLDTYGWEKMRQLLQVFRDGSSVDNALSKVYSLDTNGIEAAWKSYLGTQPR
jgi:hypothetical protein